MDAEEHMGYRDYRDYIKSSLLPEKCKEVGVDKSKVLEAFAVIEPVVTEAENKNQNMQEDLYRNWREFRQRHFPNVRTWIKLISDMAERIQMKPSERDTLFMVSYMIIAEISHTFVMNWLCCALVAADDAQTFVRRNKNWKSVSGKDLKMKLSFLKTNSLDQIVDALRFNIRNAAAHMSFKPEQGGVRIRETDNDGISVVSTETMINIGAKYDELRDGPLVWYLAIDHFYDMHHEPYRYFSDSTFATEGGVDIVKCVVARMAKTRRDW